MLAGTPQDCAYGVSLQAAVFTRKPTFAALRLFALCALRLTAHQSWRKLDCSIFRCAAESVPPAAVGSLLTAFPKRIRLALVVRVHWGMRCAPTPIRQSPQAQCSTSRWSTPMVSLYTLIRFHYICPVQATRRKTSSCLIGGKPPCGRSPPMSRTRYFMVLRFAQNTVCAGQEERTLAPHCRQSAARFTLAFCSGRSPRRQVPIRAEKCEHIVLQPTNPPIMMWAVFRTGSAWRR